MGYYDTGNRIYKKVGGLPITSGGKYICNVLTSNINYITKISSGYYFSSVLDNWGKVWAWGYNLMGSLGNNSLTDYSTPISICGAAKTFCQIGIFDYKSFAINNGGKAWGWGYNLMGSLGINSTNNKSTPVSICGVAKTFCQIKGSTTFSFGLSNGGKIWSWGYNSKGQLGNNSVISYSTPISICGAAKTFCQISGNGYQSLAINNGGKAWGWGDNTKGQLGNNSVISYSTPISICGAAKTFCQISTGSFHSLGIDNHGKVWGWGYNDKGQLGNNSVTCYSTPVSICGAAKTFCQISAGYTHSMGIDNHGKVWGWGYNDKGQLGNNSTTSKLTPVSICGAAKTFCQLLTGVEHSGGLDNHGKVWCWGGNGNGELGNNSVLSKRTPVAVYY